MMFSEKDYKAAFSQVRASEDTYLEVLNMTSRRNKTAAKGRRVAALIAAVVTLTAMTVTAFAAEEIGGWFRAFFARNTQESLSAAQIEYIENNEQIIGESKTENGWTVELRSVMHDGKTGYIIIGVTAPESIDLEPACDGDGNRLENIIPGNGSMVSGMAGASDILMAPVGIVLHNWSYSWEEDGDGLENTKNFVVHLYPDQEHCAIDPFGSEAEYNIFMENIVREYEDETYRQELMNGKYAGQTHFMLTDEETRQLFCTEVLAEGIWDFTITFSGYNSEESAERQIELITEPVSVTANIFRQIGPEISDYVHVDEAVTLTSVVVRPLTVTLTYEDCNGKPNFSSVAEDENRHVHVVLKNGVQIELYPYGSRGANYVTLEAESPIVLKEVDHILMADGTVIPMPDLTAE